MKTYGQDEYIGLDQDVLKTSSEDEDERRLQDVFKTSSSRRMFAGLDLLEVIETRFTEIFGTFDAVFFKKMSSKYNSNNK